MFQSSLPRTRTGRWPLCSSEGSLGLALYRFKTLRKVWEWLPSCESSIRQASISQRWNLHCISSLWGIVVRAYGREWSGKPMADSSISCTSTTGSPWANTALMAQEKAHYSLFGRYPQWNSLGDVLGESGVCYGCWTGGPRYCAHLQLTSCWLSRMLRRWYQFCASSDSCQEWSACWLRAQEWRLAAKVC